MILVRYSNNKKMNSVNFPEALIGHQLYSHYISKFDDPQKIFFLVLLNLQNLRMNTIDMPLFIYLFAYLFLLSF